MTCVCIGSCRLSVFLNNNFVQECILLSYYALCNSTFIQSTVYALLFCVLCFEQNEGEELPQFVAEDEIEESDFDDIEVYMYMYFDSLVSVK